MVPIVRTDLRSDVEDGVAFGCVGVMELDWMEMMGSG